MITKIKNSLVSIADKIFIESYINGEKIKTFCSLTFNSKEKEKGALASTIILGAILVTLVAGAGASIWGAFKVKSAMSTTVDGQEIGIIGSLVAGFGMVLVAIGTGLFNMCASFLSTVIDTQFITQSVTGSEVYKPIWGNVRDISNMIIVLGFVIVGIATTLRIGEYEYKKLLPKLIMLAMFINFSGLFCGVIIDAGNIIMTDLLKQGGAQESFDGLSKAVNAYVTNELKGTPAAGIGSN